ncbi:MAG: CHAT domain-containing protein [bacterium]
MNTQTLDLEKKNTLEVAYHEKGKIRLSLSESSGQGPLAFYQENEIATGKIDKTVREVIKLLNKINVLKDPDKHSLDELKKTCLFLYNELLNQEVKLRLQNTPYKALELIIDEQLVHIPWELLFDGQKFFCEQFSIGRQIKTKGDKIINHSNAVPQRFPLNMLIIANPTDDLDVAWKEGVKIYDEFQNMSDLVQIDLQSSDQVDLDFIKKNLWDYDLVHYAGHAQYDPNQPDNSGWMLSDGRFKATDIIKMGSSKKEISKLVFSNACQSGFTEKWLKKKKTKDLQSQNSYGLVHAFLMAGIQYYIGTFCDVSDKYGAYMGIEFYRHLLEGNTIGESLRKARLSFQERFGETSLSWINYVLYGYPNGYLINPKMNYTLGEGQLKNKEPIPYHKGHPPYSISVAENEVRRKGKSTSTIKKKELTTTKKNLSWHWISTGVVVIVIIFWGYPKILKERSISYEIPQTIASQSQIFENTTTYNQEEKVALLAKDHKKREYIDHQVKDLLEKMKTSKTLTPLDDWTSRPLTLWVMNLQVKGSSPQEGHDHLLTSVINSLIVQDGRIKLVERALFDKLVEELKLGTSELADPNTVLSLGKLLSARLILSGQMVYSGSQVQISLRLFETETGQIVTVITESFGNIVQPLVIAENLSNKLLEKIIGLYPIRGKISGIKGDEVNLNIGQMEGVKIGQQFKVMDKTMNEEVTLEVISTQKDNSLVKIIKGKLLLKDNMLIEVIYTTPS